MAQERKKRRIVLASILKPVDDARMFEKMGVSLTKVTEYEVFIVGYPSASTPVFKGIEFHSLGTFPRISFQRWFAKWKAFNIIRRLKPSVVIFNTHELLIPAVWLKVLTHTQVIYDVRENYYRNILHSGSFPWLIRLPLALLVRFKEKLLAPSVDHFILAERGYEKEFRFHRGGWTVIENKGLTPNPSPGERGASLSSGEGRGEAALLFSGTLAESTGVFLAIQLAKEIFKLDSKITLTIIGYAALESVRKKILEEAADNKWIKVIGLVRLVPHQEVMTAIANANFGIISYPYSEHTKNSHPTKLFEYLSAGLPIIVERRWPWTERYLANDPFIFFDFTNPDYHALLKEMKTKSFYPVAPKDVTWASEEGKFLEIMNKIV